MPGAEKINFIMTRDFSPGSTEDRSARGASGDKMEGILKLISAKGMDNFPIHVSDVIYFDSLLSLTSLIQAGAVGSYLFYKAPGPESRSGKDVFLPGSKNPSLKD